MRKFVFVFSAALAMLAAADLRAQNTNRAALGITMATNASGGAYVVNVLPGSPAAIAGVKPGDKILVVGVEAIANYNDVIRAIGDYGPGAMVNLQVERNGVRGMLSPRLAPASMLQESGQEVYWDGNPEHPPGYHPSERDEIPYQS